MRKKKLVRIRSVKPEIRILGVDDGFFEPHTKGVVDVVGVVFRGGYWLDGVMQTEVEIDGVDATEKIASMILNSPHYDQLQVVFLNGVTFGGFNVVDLKELLERIELPVMAVSREKPDFERIKRALKNLPESGKRWKAIENAGKAIEVQTRNVEESIHAQIVGMPRDTATRILKNTSTRSNIPEALRVAHIIASGLSRSKEKI
ncbi:MAG: DUF99 family protein [Candidatus Bathyarchaeota archaeon]|nr:MAG: DUF99 family protein [Candidatus Bathyarchaeota archaeon]